MSGAGSRIARRVAATFTPRSSKITLNAAAFDHRAPSPERGTTRATVFALPGDCSSCAGGAGGESGTGIDVSPKAGALSASSGVGVATEAGSEFAGFASWNRAGAATKGASAVEGAFSGCDRPRAGFPARSGTADHTCERSGGRSGKSASVRMSAAPNKTAPARSAVRRRRRRRRRGRVFGIPQSGGIPLPSMRPLDKLASGSASALTPALASGFFARLASRARQAHPCSC